MRSSYMQKKAKRMVELQNSSFSLSGRSSESEKSEKLRRASGDAQQIKGEQDRTAGNENVSEERKKHRKKNSQTVVQKFIREVSEVKQFASSKNSGTSTCRVVGVGNELQMILHDKEERSSLEGEVVQKQANGLIESSRKPEGPHELTEVVQFQREE